jgi:hypothetical protein
MASPTVLYRIFDESSVSTFWLQPRLSIPWPNLHQAGLVELKNDGSRHKAASQLEKQNTNSIYDLSLRLHRVKPRDENQLRETEKEPLFKLRRSTASSWRLRMWCGSGQTTGFFWKNQTLSGLQNFFVSVTFQWLQWRRSGIGKTLRLIVSVLVTA